jgi:hypothetical protein
MPEVTCAHCGGNSHKTPGNVALNKTGIFFCKRECRIAYYKEHGRSDSAPHVRTFIAVLNNTSKAFYNNCCWCAMGICDRCKAPDCSGRDWRKQGRELPA